MKKSVEIILPSIVIALSLLLTALAAAGARDAQSGQRCTGIDIRLLDSASNKFLCREDILRAINRDFGGQMNRLRDCVNVHKLEKALNSGGYMENSNAYFTDDGTLHVEVTQKTPVLKLHDSRGKLRYVGRKGEALEVTNDWCVNLPEVKGDLPMEDGVWMERLSGAVSWISGNEVWKEAVTLITADSRGNLTITLNGRDETFILGSPTSIPEKFGRIDHYLNHIVPALPEDRPYKEIDVKYDGQVVCR